ncbi:tRNA threonylcarbamoyladenosine dehydratase [bacterium]|nr:MAG: tRNA threonylcarbamoyladenosine dehydratase [bacterium]
MQHRFSRLEMLIGPDGLAVLTRSRVAVFGLGGVGSFAVEALARSGLGRLYLVDYDEVCLTNTNRQLHAVQDNIGLPKTEVMAARIHSINPACIVLTKQVFYSPDNREDLLGPDHDYVVDAIDTVSAKIDLILRARELGLPIISCLGMGNKFDPQRLAVADISRTHTDPLAKVVRKELRVRGITDGVKVVFSSEPPAKPLAEVADCRAGCICARPGAHEWDCTKRRSVPGSTAFVPPAAGLLIAAEVVKDLLRQGSEH